jgi:hypothetical protein
MNYFSDILNRKKIGGFQMKNVIEFIGRNWISISNFLIILVGLSAVWIYKAQEKAKIQDAASLIILQIDELQIRMQEIQSYITEQGLNFSAFYESLLLIDTNYWNKYKHLFVRKIDNKSYNNLNKFYQYVLCIQEQQELLRNLQKNYFFIKQNAISNTEFMYINETLREVEQSIISQEQLQNLINSIPKDGDNGMNQQTISNLIIQLQQKNPNIDVERFWTIYQNKRQLFLNITNGNSLTTYTPAQISTTIQAVLKQYALLEITGIEGYKKLRKMANMTDK